MQMLDLLQPINVGLEREGDLVGLRLGIPLTERRGDLVMCPAAGRSILLFFLFG